MGNLQTVAKHMRSLGHTNGGEDNEKLEQASREFTLFLESAPYNPMLNYVILQKIFEYSSRADLLRFRRVCKTYHEIVTSHLLQKYPIRLVATHEDDLTKLLNVAKNSTAFPVQTFYIKIHPLAVPQRTLFKTLSLPCIVSLKIVIESKHFPGTLKTIEMHMKSLKHLVINRLPEQRFEEIVYALSPTPGGAGKLPNLVSLTLRNVKPRRNFLARHDGAVVDLIRAAHGSLQYLEFWHWGLLTKILRESNFKSLKCLRMVGSKLSESDMMALIEKDMTLNRFRGKVVNVGIELIREFLNKRISRRVIVYES